MDLKLTIHSFLFQMHQPEPCEGFEGPCTLNFNLFLFYSANIGYSIKIHLWALNHLPQSLTNLNLFFFQKNLVFDYIYKNQTLYTKSTFVTETVWQNLTLSKFPSV